MSTRIMAACWPLQIPSTPKFVLIALADNANDAGYCWPSIDTICERTSFGRTAVIDAIRWLENAGFLAANRSNGRKTTYTISVTNQSASRTGAPAGPVREVDGTSTPRVPVPVRQADSNRHITVKEPHNKERAASAPPARPDDVPASVWSDFLAVRKAKRSPLSQTALDLIRKQADKAGMSLSDALAVCCERGWQAFRADWVGVQANESAGKRGWWLDLGYGDEAMARKDGHKPRDGGMA